MGLKKKRLFKKTHQTDIPSVITTGMPIDTIYDDGLVKYKNCYSYVYEIDGDYDIDTLVAIMNDSRGNVSIKINQYKIPINGENNRTYLILTAYASSPELARADIYDVAVELKEYGLAYNHYFVTDRLRSLFDFFNFSTDRKFLDGFLTEEEWSDFRHSKFDVEYGKPFNLLIGPDDIEFDREMFRLNNRYGQVLYLQHVADILNINTDAVENISKEYVVSAEIDKDKDGIPCLSVIILHYADSIKELKKNSEEICKNFKKEKVHVAPMPYRRQKEGLNSLAPTGVSRLMLGKIIKN